MYRFTWWITSLLVAFTITTVQASGGRDWQPVNQVIHKTPQDPREYRAITLSNGMTVLLVSDPQAPKALAALTLPIGSLDDFVLQPGLAHYLEHMVFMGSKRYPRPNGMDDFLRKNGGSGNASTAPNRTSFYLEVDNNAFAPAVDRLADAIAAPLLDPKYADKERNAVNAELTMARANDSLRMAQVRAETLNPAHPASRFSGGNLETLRDKPGSELDSALKQFWQQYYSANLMKGVLYSNKSIDDMTQIAVSTFGLIENRYSSVPEITAPSLTKDQKEIIIHYVPAKPRRQLKLEFKVDNNSERFRSKTDTLIGYLIGNRSKNTLSDWLQNEGLIEAIDAGGDPTTDRNSGVFSVVVNLTDKGMAERDRVVAAIFSYLDLLRKKGVDKRYFDEMANVLNIDYRYPSIRRDMSYVDWLSELMLYVPLENTLNAPYLADIYDRKEIKQRLSALTPDNVRVWYISAKEPHNKSAYFVNAPYQVEKINAVQQSRWKSLAKGISLSLPEINPYIPDDFSLIPAQSQTYTHPQPLIDQSGLRVFYMPSRYHSTEPKASVLLALRHQRTMDTARHQVLFALNDYLAGIALDQLTTQAAVGGMSFSSGENEGLVLSASGYSQRLPELLHKALEIYATYTPTEDQLKQAKFWYEDRLEEAEKGKAFEQAIQPVSLLSELPYTEREERRKLLWSISLQELADYRNNILTTSTPEMLVTGNLSPNSVSAMAQRIKQQLNNQGAHRQPGQYILVNQPIKANIQKAGTGTDNALATVYIPVGYSEYRAQANSALLAKILRPWFFYQLRTEEQLGYAVFAFQTSVGRQWGLGFLLQSSHQKPSYLLSRYEAFYVQAEKRLRAMSKADFAQYQTALINELQQKPQTLDEEAGRFFGDFNRENYRFDSREKLIAEVKKLTPDRVADFYYRAVIQKRGLAMMSQISGEEERKAKFASRQGWRTWSKVSHLQQIFPVTSGKP